MMMRFQSFVFGLVMLAASGFALAADTDPVKLINAYMAEWNKHDPAAAAAYIAEDGEFLDASVGVPQVGRDNARDKVIKVFIDAVPDMTWKMIGTPIVQGQNIAFEWRFEGTNTGAWGADTPATNRTLVFKGVSYIRIKDGKIQTQHDYYDALSFNKQLGW